MHVLDRPHIKQGRTMAEGIAAGNYYSLRNDEIRIQTNYPQAITPEESIELWQASPCLRPLPAGTVLKAYRYLPGSKIGCTIVEFVGEYEVPA